MTLTGTSTTLRSTRREQFDALRHLNALVRDGLTVRVQTRKLTSERARQLLDRFEDALKTMEMMADLSEVGL